MMTAPSPFAPQLAMPALFPNLLPPLVLRVNPNFIPPVADIRAMQDGGSLRERNRVAAKKWRKKKDEHLSELEDENDKLRERAFGLCSAVRKLAVENSVLEAELGFFQDFMRKIMNQAKA
jgi:hypothetical protein